MNKVTPSIEFFVGLSEILSNVKLKQNKRTKVFTVVMFFEKLKAIEKFQSFTNRTYGDLRLIDEEGTISVIPSDTKFIFGGDEGDELKQVQCSFEIEQSEHWERFMRFMERYATENEMEFNKK
jgi:photosystem II Psb28-2 protein